MLFISVQAELKYLENTLNYCTFRIFEYFHSFWKNFFKSMYFGNQKHLAKIRFCYQLGEPLIVLPITLDLIAVSDKSFHHYKPQPLYLHIYIVLNGICGVLIGLRIDRGSPGCAAHSGTCIHKYAS